MNDWRSLPRRRASTFERFWVRVREDMMTGCWLWQGGRNAAGYGYFSLASGRRGAYLVRAHRWAYRLLVGPIPSWLEIDHLCRNRACVNPTHMELVTSVENIRRGENHNRNKTRCPAGHLYIAANTYVDRLGRRYCRACRRLRARPLPPSRRSFEQRTTLS